MDKPAAVCVPPRRQATFLTAGNLDRQCNVFLKDHCIRLVTGFFQTMLEVQTRCLLLILKANFHHFAVAVADFDLTSLKFDTLAWKRRHRFGLAGNHHDGPQPSTTAPASIDPMATTC